MEKRGAGIHILIIGGGPGGYTAAVQAAQLGATVTLVEKDRLGGICLNRGCIPTKALLQTANLLWQMKNADRFGISIENVLLNFEAATKHKETIVQKLVDGVGILMAKNKVSVIKGAAEIVNERKVKIYGSHKKLVAPDKIIIATGAEPTVPAIEGIKEKGVITSDDVLTLKSLPESIIIIGGGYIGLEFAQIFNRMNTKVNLVEMESHVLPNEDEDIAGMLEDMLKKEGIDIFTNAQVKRIKTYKNGNTAVFMNLKDKEKKLIAKKVLVAVGRSPYTDNLGLKTIGIETDAGRIIVNNRLETNIKNIYAIGDVIGRAMLAHVATAEGRCAARNAAGINSTMNYRAIPRCIYTSPEVAAVGLTEREAKETHDNVRTACVPFAFNGKALIMDETGGMVKFIAEDRYKELLGVSIVGPQATEIIAEAVFGIQIESTFTDFAHTMHAHPTLSEALLETALEMNKNWGELDASFGTNNRN
jgi:dihydrolipoamide dehydrogenase